MKHTTYLQLTAEIQDLDSEEKLIAYLVATYDIARVLTNRLRRKQNCKSILTEKQISNIRDKNIQLEGYAESASSLISLIETSSFFKDVSFSSTTIKDRKFKKERFRIKAMLE